ncbi:hypothetical protein [Mastigocoleus testarum]|uniref:Uncharacterized protein n=1 Tax=Mastigocoleus testarum BC008 TaxID=371196 RepID=A0A0V7ZF19_9CYAN|nr:hypothetical protein [Mastigocoleus testarum]KST62373.1 hypothetical protein BC008_09395 [Mastigocoleus testarum BC008]KST63097.1 hypothetical protein BC008_12360 [Mastigocoleus testarum BC008]
MTEEIPDIQTKEKPKICAIDLAPEIIEALQKRGLQCFSGTLGSQIEVPNSDYYTSHPCLLNCDFPDNLHEYDIVIVDLQEQEPIKYDESHHQKVSKSSEQTIFLSSYPATIFDPRPPCANILVQQLKDIFQKESVIVVFASSPEEFEYHLVSIRYHGPENLNSHTSSLYDFLPFLQGVNKKTGQQVNVTPQIKEGIGNFLQKYTNNFIYKAIFKHPVYSDENYQVVKRDNFIPLLLNANNEIVSFFYLQPEYPLKIPG